MQTIPLIGEKKRDGECSLMQQLTHPAHPKGSYRLRTCFGGKAGKIRNTGSRQKNANGKKQSKAKTTVQYRQNISLRRKEFCIS